MKSSVISSLCVAFAAMLLVSLARPAGAAVRTYYIAARGIEARFAVVR